MSVYSVSGDVTYPGGANSFDILNVQAGYILTDAGPGAPASFQPLPAPSQSLANRSLDVIFQISPTQNCFANYSVDISVNSGAAGTIFFEISLDAEFAKDVQLIASFYNSISTQGDMISQTITSVLNGFIPSGYYVRLRTQDTVGLPLFSYVTGQEVLL